MKLAFSKGVTTINTEQCEKHLQSLQRLESNYYANRYKLTVITNSASGLNKECCNLALTPEVQESLEKQGRFLNGLRVKFEVLFSKIRPEKS